MLAAYMAKRLHIPVFHMEAGTVLSILMFLRRLIA